MVWAHTVRPYGMPTENEFTCVIFIWFRCLECCVTVYTVRRGRRTLRDNVYRWDRTVNHGRKTVQIRPQKTFSKKFEKRVDETGILLYTKQVVSERAITTEKDMAV